MHVFHLDVPSSSSFLRRMEMDFAVSFDCYTYTPFHNEVNIVLYYSL
jgi:hypothetical protein